MQGAVTNRHECSPRSASDLQGGASVLVRRKGVEGKGDSGNPGKEGGLETHESITERPSW